MKKIVKISKPQTAGYHERVSMDSSKEPSAMTPLASFSSSIWPCSSFVGVAASCRSASIVVVGVGGGGVDVGSSSVASSIDSSSSSSSSNA